MIVSNSSCLIILIRLEKLDLLQKMYGRITIPGSVKNEVFKRKKVPDWIDVVKITQPVAYEILEKTLGKGESEAITLCLEAKADLLIVDDLAARKTAQRLGIKVAGVIGILLEAKRVGLLPHIKDFLDQMMSLDFRISKTVYDDALELANERQPAQKVI
jgi:predicted nucleic acid-binding protein